LTSTQLHYEVCSVEDLSTLLCVCLSRTKTLLDELYWAIMICLFQSHLFHKLLHKLATCYVICTVKYLHFNSISSAIGMILSSVSPSVHLSVCDKVYCGAQGRCRGLKVVPSVAFLRRHFLFSSSDRPTFV